MCAHLQGAPVAQLQEEPGLAVGEGGGAERRARAVPHGHAGADVAAERAPRVRDGAHHVDMTQPCCDVRLNRQAIFHARLVIVHDDLRRNSAADIRLHSTTCNTESLKCTCKTVGLSINSKHLEAWIKRILQTEESLCVFLHT